MGRWLIGASILFFVLTLLSGVVEMEYFDSEHVGLLNIMMQPDLITHANPTDPDSSAGGVMDIGKNIVDAVWVTMTFDYSMFEGAWWYFRVLFSCVSIGMIWYIAQFFKFW